MLEAISVKFSKSIRNDLLFVALAFVWFTHRNEQIPGFHLDEAWVMIRSHSILGGDLPVNGMNAYTGALQQYLLVPFIWIFGESVGVYRSVSALLMGGALFLFLQSARTLTSSSRMI
jgi:hypothetical protein